MMMNIHATRERLKSLKPLVLNITNYVTMDIMANGLLALGASPIMTVCDEELEALVRISHTVNMNIGTLDDALIRRCHLVIALAKQYGKPVILDPVGAGASHIRTEIAQSLLAHVDIVRGNASEVMALINPDTITLGVDSAHASLQARDSALSIAKTYGITVVVSGELDYITDGTQELTLSHGSPLMPHITGMGCLLTAVIAAFRAVTDNSFDAACSATAYYGLCGSAAEKLASRPGSFRAAFIDSLYEGVL